MYGNYKGYYKRRNENNRHQFLREEWFAHKACLDIGCNEGVVTAHIAENFKPRFILGIDCDRILIEYAKSRLKRIRYNYAQNFETDQPRMRKRPKLLFAPRVLSTSTILLRNSVSVACPEVSDNATNLKLVAGNDGSQLTNCNSSVHIKESVEPKDPFPLNLNFLHRNIFDFAGGSRYDTIICLSVAKWIHLQKGDDGLLKFFQIMYDILRPGGLIILEYQPWKSYQKRKEVSKDIHDTFNKLQILPQMFENILVERIGLHVIDRLGPSVEAATGFERPILVMQK